MRKVCALLGALFFASCASSRRDPMLEHFRPCPSPAGCITFNVSGPASERVSRTPVFLAAASGVRPVGLTDEDGVFLAPKELVKGDAVALLFCWDARSLACAAVRLDNGDAAIYDWLNVTLPANRLLHRSQARSANQEMMVPLPSPTPAPEKK